MPAQFRDYYETLGVAKTASADEIKSAFRKLARKHHPDLAKDKKTAEEKFKEINEAYEVLSNPENRKKYDSYGANWSQAGTGATGRAARGNGMSGGFSDFGGGEEFHFGGTGYSDFFEQFFGTRRGRGFGGGTHFEETPQRGSDVEADILVTLEEVLKGATRQISFRKPGSQDLQTYTVKIPEGVREGQRIRLAGQGDTGGPGGEAGDLYLRVKLQQHPDFYFEGSNIIHDLEIPVWQAVLGGELTIPTPDGRAKLKIPAGTEHGKKFRISGRGLPVTKGTRGDFFAVTEIKIPIKPSPAEKVLWEQLRALDIGS
ncbi:MAG: DnaJ C-terminal domain-containing protein [Chthoniobacterales bacterium]